MADSANQHFALTTPLYYVNAAPHIGSAYTTMAADAIARFQRLNGHSVRFITGTDEHGQKIQRTAEDAGIPPQIHCDRVADSFTELWQHLNITYDRFSRTTNPRHLPIVREFFQRVWEQGDIYKDQQRGWYCVGCEEFKEERELLDDHRCPLHPNKPTEWRDEENYFFRLSKYQAPLEKLFADNPDFVKPVSRRNEVLSFIQRGLRDFSISRVSLTWGIPLPADESHTIYVWFDALLGYVTALLEPGQDPTLENALADWWPINLHLLGKDILRFHAIYWPAMLLSAQLPLPQQLFVHGFLTKDGQKMGKSLGNTIDPVALIEQYGADAVRYYFLKEIEFGRDGDFSESRFITVLNADLANDLGNLLNRTLGMAKKYCDSQIPVINVDDIPENHPLKSIGSGLCGRVKTAYKNCVINRACQENLELVRACNKYIDDSAPWSLFKQQKQTEVEIVLYTVLESLRLAAYLMAPVIPQLSTAVYQQLGLDIDFNATGVSTQCPLTVHGVWGYLPSGKKLRKAQPIFARIETET
ncbi:MAG: methionine--tRNA ligase [Cyanobacteria bacterium P01_H01_bin.15]